MHIFRNVCIGINHTRHLSAAQPYSTSKNLARRNTSRARVLTLHLSRHTSSATAFSDNVASERLNSTNARTQPTVFEVNFEEAFGRSQIKALTCFLRIFGVVSIGVLSSLVARIFPLHSPPTSSPRYSRVFHGCDRSCARCSRTWDFYCRHICGSNKTVLETDAAPVSASGITVEVSFTR